MTMLRPQAPRYTARGSHTGDRIIYPPVPHHDPAGIWQAGAERLRVPEGCPTDGGWPVTASHCCARVVPLALLAITIT